MTPWLCDVQDVTRAHLLAATTPAAHGRYLVSNRSEVSTKAVVEVLAERFPQYKWPKDVPDKDVKDFADTSKVVGPWAELLQVNSCQRVFNPHDRL